MIKKLLSFCPKYKFSFFEYNSFLIEYFVEIILDSHASNRDILLFPLSAFHNGNIFQNYSTISHQDIHTDTS